jgi:hypothetical protein
MLQNKFAVSVKRRPIALPRWPYPARVMHWHERYGLSYIAWKQKYEGWPAGISGDPAVVPLIHPSDWKPPLLTPELEWWWYGLMRQASHGTLNDDVIDKCYANTLDGAKAYTDYSGWTNGNQSVVLNVNLGASLMRMGGRIANGATVIVTGDAVQVAGHWCWPIRLLDALDKNTLLQTWGGCWWGIFAATNSVYNPFPYGVVDPFPIFGDAGWSVPVPLLGQGTTTGYIECDWLEWLPYGTAARQWPYYKTNYIMKAE